MHRVSMAADFMPAFTRLSSRSWSRSARRQRRARRRLRIEPLEVRTLLDGMPVISELMAVNDLTIQDEDGDDSDWIEIHNAGDAPADMGGWFLTDDPNDLARWTFPNVNIEPGEQLLVFASGKNRAVAGSELHTDFNLAGGGEYLALVQPDGVTIATEYDDYPAQVPDVSYGLAVDASLTTVLDAGAAATAFVPADDLLELSWTEPGFDDTGWTAGTTGVGYDTEGGYDSLIGLDLEPQLAGVNSSAYIRVPFTVDDAGAVDLLNLEMQYDDGFAAYLNGREVARRNALPQGEAPVLAHWPFDEPEGSSVSDASSGEKHGTLAGTGGSLAAAGVFNASGDLATGGLSLSNGADYVAVPAIDLRTTSFTIGAWINPTAIDSGDEIFGDWSSPWQFRLFLNANGSITFSARRDGPGVNDGDLFSLTTPAGSITTGTYQHIAISWDRIDRTARLWVDGQNLASRTIGPQNVDLNESFHGEYQIGWKKDSGAGGSMYEGLIDEMWIFDEALDGEQVGYLIDNNAYLPSDSQRQIVDLADLVGGGDGTLPGIGSATGINAVTGAVAQPIAGGNHEPLPGEEGTYVPIDVEDYEAVDGVFLPDGVIGPQVIDGAGRTFDFAGVADNSPAYNVIANGPAGVDPSGMDLQPDFTGNAAAHSILGMHAQQGITFDLNTLRQWYPDVVPRRFTAFAGQSRTEGSTNYFVLFDGQVAAAGSFAGIGHDALDVAIPASAEYLTLVTTNSNVNVNSADHSYFGDPFVILDRVAENADIDLADVVGGGDGFGNGTAIGINAANGDVGTTAGGNLYPNTPGDYYPVQEYGFVDGVFVPDGNVAGGQAIDAAGTFTFDFAGAANSESSYGQFFNGVNTISNPSNLGAAPDYGNPDNAIISAHAQKGITFDLQAIRDNTGRIPALFSSLVGESRGQAGGSVAWFVLVDGVDKASGLLTDNETFVEVELLPTDLFLTFVMANANNGNGSDHGYFGDPTLLFSTDGGGPDPDPQGNWNLTALGDRPDALATTFESIDVSAYRDLLLDGPGANVLAIHAMNVAADDADLLIVPRLQTGEVTLQTDVERYFTIPTPGEPNSGGLENPPPRVWDVGHSPNQPDATEAVVIEAEVSDPDGLASVVLSYQVVAPGRYLPAELPLPHAELLANPLAPRQPNPEFTDPANWTLVTMVDDGTGVDEWAGDGIYSAVIAPRANRTLVRYRVTATDTTGSAVRAPLPNDPSLNFAYYVYDGVPDYVAADRSVTPDGAGYVHDSETLESLPVYTLITDAEDLAEVIGYDGADRIPKSNVEARSAFNWEGAFVYDGKVYDHVRYRLRQANDRYGGSGKRGMRFRFNKGNYLQARDIWGEPYPTEWRTLNVSKMSDNKRVGNFGLVETMNLLTWNMAGVPAPYSHWFHFRVVDGEEEAPAGTNGQYYGDFWGMSLAYEDYDSRFLDAHDMADGNLYKLKDQIYDGNALKRHQGTFSVRDDSDFQNIRANLRPERDADWLNENVDYDKWYRYHTVIEAIRHYDYRPSDTHSKNRAWYFEPSETNPLGRLWTLPYDHDSSWGPNFNLGEDYSKQAIFGYSDGTGAKPEFKQAYRNTIREFRDLFWTEDVVNPLIDRLAAIIDGFVLADRDRWTNAPADAGTENYGSLDAKVQNMKEFAFVGWSGSTGPTVGPGGRAAYLDSLADAEGDATNIPDTPAATSIGPGGFPVDALSFQTTPFSDPQGNQTFAALQWRIAEVADPTAPAYDPNAPPLFEYNAAWQSGELATFSDQITVPIDAVRVGHAYRARVRMKDDTGRWSHWSDPVQFVVGPTENTQALMAGLRVTEINFNPHDPTAEERAVDPMLVLDNDDFEFVELANVGLDVFELTEVAFTDGVQFPFATGAVTTLAPGERVLIVRDAAAFAVRYDTAGLLIAGEYRDPVDGSNKLSNSGEPLRIEGFGGTIIAEFEYNDAWYPQTDGEGFTLVAADPAGALDLWNRKDGWLPSHRAGGTPGAGPDAALVLPGTIVVNEVLANSAGTPGDWIELANVGPSPVDVGGWLLSNSPLEPAMYRIAAPAVLAPGATLALTEAGHFGAASTDPGVILPFSLSPYGGTVYVAAADPVTGKRLGYRSEQSFGASDLGVSLGRHVKSTGGKDFVALATPTPDGPNALPLVGPLVINEIMYHPPYGEQEFIEIRNSSGTAVPLDDGQGNAWRLRGAIDFTFPLGQSIPAGGFALAIQGVDLGDAAAEADAFRTAYGVPVEVPIFVYTGLDNGSLSNDSEKLFLDRPGDPNSGLPVLPYILVDAVKYDDGTDDSQGWPVQADGAGSALGRIASAAYGNDVANWAATAVGGSPGVANTFIDTTAPTVPEGLSATIAGSSRVDLAWLPSSDPETGVEHYNVYRDGQLIGSSNTESFPDTDGSLAGTMRFEVSAVNTDGVESARSTMAVLTVGVLSLQDGVLPDATFTGIEDAYIAESTPNDPLGGLAILKNDGSPDERSLLRWSVADIPEGSRVLGVTIDVRIFNQSSGTYSVYAALRDWAESEVTWNQFAAASPWEAPGAAGTADVGTVELYTFPAATSGSHRIELNAAGIALVQQWVDGTASNFGLFVTNPNNGDSMQFYSSDDATLSRRPKITVTYVESAVDAQVTGRYVFYNHSAFDGNGPSAGARDDDAVAIDKTALLPGESPEPANYTNYDAGLNGVMIDIEQLAYPEWISAADFQLRVGSGGDPSSWTAAPAANVSVRPLDGTDGTDGTQRISFIWPDGAIRGQWLEVTVLADDVTGLPADDVFYFGNAPGDTANSPDDALVNAADLIAIRDNSRGPANPAGIDNPFDVNRDGRVNAIDLILARDNATSPLSALRLITPSAASPAPLSPANAEGRMFPPAGEGESTFATQSSASTGTASLESLDGLMAAHAGQPAVDSLSLPSPLLGKLLRRLGSAI